MEQIGEGGFGLVFVAEQQQPIRRKVALKIIKPGMDTRDVIARFEAERQALALMDHPNIARVLDAGTTDSGRPYFVMELVRGIPITDYCDQNQLTPRERLELFVPVCNAVQHAHQKGIIHRDIKPSNVLVTLHDGRPVVKVIDFGVAKALHQPLTETTIYTRFAQMIGTPLYMSPEQAEMSGLDIDTRTDIYSLGVLLVRTPHRHDAVRQAAPGQGGLRRAAQDHPRGRAAQAEHAPEPVDDSLPSIAAQRKTEPAKLSKMFHGDLDWIAMKALEKDRTRRYETANAFAADVLRYLNDEPVEASPPSTSYRLRKFARKHRAALATASLFAMVLVVGTVVSIWQAVRATQAEAEMEKASNERFYALGVASTATKIADDRLAEAEAERKNAERQRDRAEQQFATGLLRPIGYSDRVTDPAELHSYVDGFAIPNSSLKLRVLEIAFDNPESALRVARRAERVIQSCVGLSPIRRAQAIKLVSSKQCDLKADPRIRVGACWLALELGSANLPAWTESCKWLSDPKNRSIKRFDEFLKTAASRSDPQQIAQMSLDPLIEIIEKPSDDSVQWSLCDGIRQLATRFQPAQTKRAWDALISLQEKTTGPNVDTAANAALVALAPRLELVELKRIADALIEKLEESTDSGVLYAANRGLTVVGPRLELGQERRAADAVIGFLKQSSDIQVLATANRALTALAPRLEPAQITRAADALISILQKPIDADVFSTSMNTLKVLTARLEPAQIKRVGDLLIGIVEKSTGPDALNEVNSPLTVLAARMEPRKSIARERC